MKKYLSIGTIVLAAILVVVFAFRIRTKEDAVSQQTPAPAPIQVSIRSLNDARTAVSEATFPATVSSESEAVLVAHTSGTIVADTVTLGEKTTVGALLYRIDETGNNTVHEQTGFESNTLLQAKLALKNAEESYAQAKRTYENNKSSANKTARDIQKNLRDITKSQYESLLDAHTVKSPLTGTIYAKSASLGDAVSPGTPLATIGAGKKIARFSVSGDERALLAPRQKVTFSQSNGKTITGFISRIAPAANDSNKQFLIEAESTDPNFAALPSGTLLTLSVTFTRRGEQNEILLPLSALAQEQTGTFVFILENDRARKIPVQIGVLYGETVTVSGDFSNNPSFIVSNVKRLSDGVSVTVAN